MEGVTGDRRTVAVRNVPREITPIVARRTSQDRRGWCRIGPRAEHRPEHARVRRDPSGFPRAAVDPPARPDVSVDLSEFAWTAPQVLGPGVVRVDAATAADGG